MKRFILLVGICSSATGLAETSLQDLVGTLTEAHAEIMSTVPGYYLFTDGETGTDIDDGGGDMYDGGNFLNTNLASAIPYTNGQIRQNAGFGQQSSYFTMKLPGLFIAAASEATITTFSITGNLGADGSGEAIGWELDINHFGSAYKVYIKQVHGAGDPSVNHVIIVPSVAGLQRTFSTNTDDDLHRVTGLANASTVFYALIAGTNGKLFTREEITAFVSKVLPFIAADIGGHTCLLKEGQIYCFGRNNSGQLGLGDDEPRGDEPAEMESMTPVELGDDFVAISVKAGANHTCALSEAGKVKCFGANEVGQLGQGDVVARGNAAGQMGNSLAYVDLGEDFVAKSISVGFDHSCAVSMTGLLKCWGGNEHGQLGAGSAEPLGDEPGELGNDLSPVDFGEDNVVREIATGVYFTCAILSDTSTRCFGAGGKGQLGNGFAQDIGTSPDHMGAALIPVRLPDVRPTAIALGSVHACVVTSIGKVYCWGDNSSGELGTGDVLRRGSDMETTLTPVDLGALQFVEKLACGFSHCCAKTIQGTMKCWGKNGEGQLACGDTEARGGSPQTIGEGLPFVALPPLAAVADVWAGSAHTCILTGDEYRCWGLNNYGQLGQGDTMNRGGSEQTLPIDIIPIALP